MSKFPSRRNCYIQSAFDSEEQRDLYDWMYEYTCDHAQATMLWGLAMGIAGDHPDWTLWQVVAEIRRRCTQ